jgi:hypothetical protein
MNGGQWCGGVGVVCGGSSRVCDLSGIGIPGLQIFSFVLRFDDELRPRKARAQYLQWL